MSELTAQQQEDLGKFQYVHDLRVAGETERHLAGWTPDAPVGKRGRRRPDGSIEWWCAGPLELDPVLSGMRGFVAPRAVLSASERTALELATLGWVDALWYHQAPEDSA